MALENFQKLILRLYLDENAKTGFFEASDAFLDNNNLRLSDREKKAAMNLDRHALSLFSRSLLSKKTGFLKKAGARNTQTLIISSFYENGPAMHFQRNGEEITLDISNGAFHILKNIEKGISLRSLFKSFIASENGGKDLWNIILITQKYRLWGRQIRLFP